MRISRVLATGAVLAAIGGCAVLVVSFAAAESTQTAQPVRTTPTAQAADPTASLAATAGSVGDVVVPTVVATPSRVVSPTASPRRTTPHPASSSRIAQRARTSARHSTPPRTTHAAPPPPKPSSKPAPPRRGQALPLGYGTGSATRVLTVVAQSSGSRTAVLQAWYRTPGGGWLRHGSGVAAHVGSQGLTTHPSESRSATPIGSFGLTQAFGRASDPGTALPYFRTSASDWWVSDASSRYYNTHYRCASSCPFNTGAGENLYAAGFVYTYAVVIDYNRFPVTRGAGSAFFLHVTNGSATAGCVSISETTLVSLMRWLGPAAHPRILIGVA
jgi:L,D-peptidoglycan transpeptidase YkuD (ErfK/YbiS/YcfS/YnhG family)